MLVKAPPNPEVEKEIDKIKDQYLELNGKVSELRKKGKNSDFAEILLLDIPAKIKMVELTLEKRDLEITKRSIKDIEDEIIETETGGDFKHLNELIQEAFEHIRKGEIDKAKENYPQIMALYKNIPKDSKKVVYSACARLAKLISK